MKQPLRIIAWLLFASTAFASDWRQFRGPTGQGICDEKGLPTEWSSTKNIVWKLKMPGAGASSPVILGNRVFITAYSGYGLDTKNPGDQKDLKRHLLCVDRASGKVIWSKDFDAVLPEHNYKGEGAYQGYAASTPITDGEHLYVFFGKTGVYCFDLDGKQIWHTSVGKGVHAGWGSGASPMFYKNLLIVNACCESGNLIALDKKDGKEVWRAWKPDKKKDKEIKQPVQFGNSWGIPLLVKAKDGLELALSIPGRVVAFDPDTGKELWSAKGHGGYVVPSLVTHDGIVYAVGGGGTSLAIRSGGRGEVTETHVIWREKKGSNASSPVYLDGFLYWTSESGGVIHRQDAATGKCSEKRLVPDAGRIWGSPVLADGKLYFVSQHKGTYVVAANEKLDLITRNFLEDDSARTNSSIAVSDGQIFLRTDANLYCIGKK
jgi:outer membrane protein assembly factor BamB